MKRLKTRFFYFIEADIKYMIAYPLSFFLIMYTFFFWQKPNSVWYISFIILWNQNKMVHYLRHKTDPNLLTEKQEKLQYVIQLYLLFQMWIQVSRFWNFEPLFENGLSRYWICLQNLKSGRKWNNIWLFCPKLI